MICQKKTRAVAAWAERRGFSTCIQERMFAADFKRQADEPAVALCGLDNGAGRRALDQVGFDLIVEAGLGRGYRDFRTMRLHVLPGRRAAADIWKQSSEGEKVEDRPAYAKLMEDGVLDRCGMTLLAGKAVGAPFVGSIAATLALSEVVRLLHGGAVCQLIDTRPSQSRPAPWSLGILMILPTSTRDSRWRWARGLRAGAGRKATAVW